MVESPWCLLNLELHDEDYNTCQCHGLGLDDRHTFYSHQTLQVMGLGLVLGLRILVMLSFSVFKHLTLQHILFMKFPARP